MQKVRVVFPEFNNQIIQEAIAKASEIEAIPAENLEEACKMIANGQADSMVAGIDYTSREVILASREYIGAKGKTFSASFILTRDDEEYLVADAAACKNPTAEQLFDIVCQSFETARAVLTDQPRVAMLSFSTMGSGGKDPSMEKIATVLERLKSERPEILVDGELQLDSAVVPEVATKKAPGSVVAGQANVLICPDLNSGNILYKAMQRFGGFVAAGPILQGFNAPISDLSRGSTTEDVLAVIEVEKKLVEKNHG